MARNYANTEQAPITVRRRTRHRSSRPTPRLRLAVYQKSAYRCRHCGWAPHVPDDYDGRQALGEGYMCASTGRYRVRVLEIDHIYPHVLGGRLRIENCQALCNSCNARKGARV